MKKSLFVLCLIFISLTSTLIAQQKKVDLTGSPLMLLPFRCGNSKEDSVVQASAVESIGVNGKYLLVADDKCKFLLVIDSQTRETVKFLKWDENSPDLDKDGIPEKPKWEGLARDAENYYYVIGAHQEKSDNRESHLLRFLLKTPDPDNAKTFYIDSFTELNISTKLKMLAGKVKVEGLAVKIDYSPDKKVSQRTLVIGLREPKNPVRVLMADITILPKNKESVDLCPYFTFPAGKANGVDLCLSSITYVDQWKGYLILTSTEIGDCQNSQGDNSNGNFQGNVMWFFSDTDLSSCSGKNFADPSKNRISDIFEVGNKAEGMVVFNGQGNTDKNIHIGLVYDNDGAYGKYQKATLITSPVPAQPVPPVKKIEPTSPAQSKRKN